MSEKKVSRRRLLKLMGLGVAGTTLAACQPKVVEKVVKETVVVEKEKVVKEEVEVEKEVTRVVEKEVKAPGEVTVVKAMVRAGYGGDIYRLFITNFNNERSDVRAETVDTAYAEMLKKTQAMMAAGNLPDMLTTAVKWFPAMANQGAYVPLDDMVEAKWDEYDMDDIYEFALNAQRFEGTLYGIPEICLPTPRCLVGYNKDMFDEAGIDYPGDEWDIYEWKEAALKLTKPDQQIYGASAPNIQSFYDWEAFVTGFGTHMFSNEVGLAKTFNFLDDPKVKDAWDWFRDLAVDNYGVPRRGDTMEGINMFPAGRLATAVTGIYQITALPDQIGDRFEYGLTLMRGPVQKGSAAFSNAFCVSSQTDSPEEALDLAIYLTSTEVGVYSALEGFGRGLQARRSQWTNPDVVETYPTYGVIAKWLEDDLYPFPHPWNLRYQEVFDAYQNLLEPLRYGTATWDEQAPDIQAKVQEIMDKPRP